MKGDFQTQQNDYENEIKQLIDRCNTQREKVKIIQEIADTKVQNDNQAYKFPIDYNKLKLQVQKINEDYHQKQIEIEGKLIQNIAQQADYAQIIMIPITKKNEIVIQEDPMINNQVIEDKLNMIQEQIGLLEQVKSDFLKYCKERNINLLYKKKEIMIVFNYFFQDVSLIQNDDFKRKLNCL
ncbi:hypothetical protein pb186bvf_018571 [Paramecium bursaria]